MIERRGPELEISFLGAKLRGTTRAVAGLLNSTFAILLLAGAVVWHIFDSRNSSVQILEAVWFQTIALAAPAARADVIKKAGDKIPPGVRAKIGENHEAGR